MRLDSALLTCDWGALEIENSTSVGCSSPLFVVVVTACTCRDQHMYLASEAGAAVPCYYGTGHLESVVHVIVHLSPCC